MASKGRSILLWTLLDMFKPSVIPRDAFEPLSVGQYSEYVLVPFIAVRAIAKDLSKDLEEAYAVMRSSNLTGSILQPEDDRDPDFDVLIQHSRNLAQTERSHNKPTQDPVPPKLRRQSHTPREGSRANSAWRNATPGPSRIPTKDLQLPEPEPEPESPLSPLSPLSNSPTLPPPAAGRPVLEMPVDVQLPSLDLFLLFVTDAFFSA
ncbi:hypothetical protein BU15DRAFT_68260 [Melanogaster broomeanus]|nr:hypothetical protein BU15DRAFT_68260 [Melanogaster broomeanus]